jgi:hypothetical protein
MLCTGDPQREEKEVLLDVTDEKDSLLGEV